MFTRTPDSINYFGLPKVVSIVDIDECAILDICQNGGTCTNTNGSFMCACLSGWTGDTCKNGMLFIRPDGITILMKFITFLCNILIAMP